MDREDFLNKKIKMMMQEGGYTKPQAQAISKYDLQQIELSDLGGSNEVAQGFLQEIFCAAV